jgi:hypothetical protein
VIDPKSNASVNTLAHTSSRSCHRKGILAINLAIIPKYGRNANESGDQPQVVTMSCRGTWRVQRDVHPPSPAPEMHPPRYLADDGWTSAWGISWCASRRDDVVWIGHGGWLPGFTTPEMATWHVTLTPTTDPDVFILEPGSGWPKETVRFRRLADGRVASNTTFVPLVPAQNPGRQSGP